jgi:hypothetical protein
MARGRRRYCAILNEGNKTKGGYHEEGDDGGGSSRGTGGLGRG